MAETSKKTTDVVKTMSPIDDALKLTVMLLTDRDELSAGGVDALFFHARAFHDDDGLFELASQAYFNGLVRHIVINGSNGEGADDITKQVWPGKDEYRKKLCSVYGIKQEHVIETRPALHTREENDAFLELATEKNFASAVILAQPHQIVRAFMGMVQAMNKAQYPMRIHTLTPESTNWSKTVFGSQSAEKMPRSTQIDREYNRIRYYQETGELPPFSEVFEYLKNRESMP